LSRRGRGPDPASDASAAATGKKTFGEPARAGLESPVVRDERSSTSAEPHELEDALELDRGATVGRYVILDRIGKGGMGVVYAAYDPELDRKLALKLLRTSTGDRSADRRRVRMIREAQAMARLSHPNVIVVHDVGSFDGQVFVAMEFIEGGSLAEWIKVPRPWERVVEVFVLAGRGLAAAHEAGLVHRDFKPDNVMITETGRVVVTDFGLARASGGPDGSMDSEAFVDGPRKLATTVTAQGAIMGTPAYMAPEQHEGRIVDARSDQFAFAVALYEALYGQRPFPGDDVASLAYHVGSGNIRPPPARTLVPPWVRQVLLRALSVAPEDRYPSITALLADLERDRAIRPRWSGVLIGIGLATAIGVVAGFVLDRESTPCSGASTRVAAAIGTEPQQAAKDAFLASGLSYAMEQWPAVEAALRDYGETWAASYEKVCEATHLHGEQSAALLDVRMACLSRRLDDAGALVELLGDADPQAIEHALPAVQSLPRVQACETVDDEGRGVPAPTDPTVAGEVESLRPHLARVAAFERTGVFTVGLAAAHELVERADAIEWPPLQAEAYLRLASLQRAAARWDEAERNYKEALTRALRGEADEVAADASVALVGVVARSPARASEAEGWAGVADALLARTHAEPDTRAELLQRRAELLEATGRRDDALRPRSEAILLLIGAYGDHDIRVADASAGLAKLQHALGESAEARPLLERALEITEYNVGTDHPRTAELMHLLGTVELALHDYAAAQEHFSGALAVREGRAAAVETIETMRSLATTLAATGHDDAAWEQLVAAVAVAKATGDGALHAALELDLARAAMRHGDWSLASQEARRARRAIAELPAATPSQLAEVDAWLARALLELGRLDDARTRARKAVAVLEEDAAGHALPLGEALTVLGEAALAEGDATGAIGPLERAIPLLAHDDDAEVAAFEWALTSARARFGLARALVSTGDATQRAHDLAEEARSALRDLDGPAADLRASIDAWIESQ
jgi:tetratricopeptide (TPR) repeat protein/predicted Ser/Thr protein kinase